MTSIELKERYGWLHRKMTDADDKHNRQIFFDADKWAFDRIADTAPATAQIWLDKLQAVCWNNYLTDSEAKTINASLVNQDDSIGGKWSKDTFLQTIERLGGVTEKEPYYNANALWVVANMIYSDHAKSIADDMGAGSPTSVPSDKMALSCYRKAVEKLCDRDRKHFVREYFEQELDC